MTQRIDLSSFPKFLFFRPDIPFARDDAGKFIPWIIALMVCLAGLLLCGSVTLNSSIGQYHGTYSNTFSVHIPYHGEGNKDLLQKITALLESTPGVTGINPVEGSDLKKRVAPWLGRGDVLDAIPLPTIVEVETSATANNPAPIDLKALLEQITKIAPNAEIDAHEIWIEKFSRLTATLSFFITLFAGFILACMALMMIFISKAALELHSKTVMLLHSVGADDRYIARQFQFNAGLLALRGSLPGTIAAGILLLLLRLYIYQLDAPILSGFHLSLAHFGVLLALPFLCTSIAVLAARFAVLRQLKTVL